jgi:hypothetical protein
MIRLAVGRGIDPADPVRAGARSLNDIARRAKAVGGSVVVESGRSAGSATVIRFVWPTPA